MRTPRSWRRSRFDDVTLQDVAALDAEEGAEPASPRARPVEILAPAHDPQRDPPSAAQPSTRSISASTIAMSEPSTERGSPCDQKNGVEEVPRRSGCRVAMLSPTRSTPPPAVGAGPRGRAGAAQELRPHDGRAEQQVDHRHGRMQRRRLGGYRLRTGKRGPVEHPVGGPADDTARSQRHLRPPRRAIGSAAEHPGHRRQDLGVKRRGGRQDLSVAAELSPRREVELPPISVGNDAAGLAHQQRSCRRGPRCSRRIRRWAGAGRSRRRREPRART